MGRRNDVGELFADHVTVTGSDNSKFERIARIEGKSDVLEAAVTLDIREDLFPIKINEKFKLELYSNVNERVMDDSDYVCYGTIFKVDDKGQQRSIIASFGGLLLNIEAEQESMRGLELDMRIYLACTKGAEI